MGKFTTIRVSNIRSNGKFGGSIFSGYEVNDKGYKINPHEMLVVKADSKTIKNNVYVGEVWSVLGKTKSYTGERNGYRYTEQQFIAFEAYRLSICGDNFIDYVSNHEAFVGIGRTKAQNIWEAYEERVYEYLDSYNEDAFTPFLTKEKSKLLIDAWSTHGYSGAIQWLDQMNIPSEMGRFILQVYKAETKTKIESNPYQVLIFNGDWNAIDNIAIKRLGLKENDIRRLEGAILQCLIKSFKKNKETAVSKKNMQNLLAAELAHGANHITPNHRKLAKEAMDMSHTSTEYVFHNGLFQHTGAYGMESFIASRIVGMKKEERGINISASDVFKTIEEYEEEFKITLMLEQKQAVLQSVYSPLVILSGGAGTGKTTVLRCIYYVLQKLDNVHIEQMALAGRAAKRMHEATNIEAMTIARFLTKYEKDDIEEPLPKNTCLVVDEASMIDVINAWRILAVLPKKARLILAGDHMQLPSIGPGLIFRTLVLDERFEVIKLTVNKRFAEGSGIIGVANAVREHKWQKIKPYSGKEQGVSFLPCGKNEIRDTIRKLYEELGGEEDVKTICSIKSSQQGTEENNLSIHNAYRGSDENILYYDEDIEQLASHKKKFSVNDVVMFTRNDYTRNLMNGTLGIITKKLNSDVDRAVCRVDFEGAEHDLSIDDLADVEMAYAITCHKAQGSQFKRIIVPIFRNRNLDQSLLYTALTRAVEQVVLVGNLNDAKKAAQEQAKHTKRQTALSIHFDKAFNEHHNCKQAI